MCLWAAVPTLIVCSIANHGVNSLDVIWAYTRLGFEALFRGKHPELDPYDEPWPSTSWQAHLAGRDIADNIFRGVV